MGWQPHKWACDHRPARRKHVSGKLLSDEEFRMSCFMIYPPVIQDNNGTFTMNLDYFRKGKPWILFFLLENTGGYSRHNFQVSNIYIDIYIYTYWYIYILYNMSVQMSHQPPLRFSFLLVESPSNSVESFPGRAFWRLKTRRRWQARKRKPVGKGI